MRAIAILSTLVGILTAIPSTEAQTLSPKALQQKLESQYALTQPTADNSEIVTAGAVFTLLRGPGNLSLFAATSSDLTLNIYKDGKISLNGAGKANRFFDRVNRLPGVSAPPPPGAAAPIRAYVPGEKMWVTQISVKDDGVVFDLFTDPVANMDNMRFRGGLKFPFAKGSVPSAEQVEKMVAEVFKVEPPADANANANAQAAPPSAPPAPQRAEQAAEPKLDPIAPPPPPPDAPATAPKSIALGQTKDEVVAILGAPVSVVKFGAKEIDSFKEFKVTFVSGKVTDVQ